MCICKAFKFLPFPDKKCPAQSQSAVPYVMLQHIILPLNQLSGVFSIEVSSGHWFMVLNHFAIGNNAM